MGKFATSLNKYLKARRKEVGLSQSDVAKALGYSSPQFVSNWERELVSPPLSALPILMDILQIRKEVLVELVLKDTRQELDAHLKNKTPAKKKA